MATKAELLDIARQAVEEGDEATAHAAMDAAEKLQSEPAAPASFPDVPSAAPQAQPIAQQQPEYTIPQKLVGGTEAAISTALSPIGALGGQILGGIKGISESLLSGKFGTTEGANQAGQIAADYSEKGAGMFAPSTPAGKEYANNIAEKLSPLAQLDPGMTPYFAGRAAPLSRPAIKQARAISEESAAMNSSNPWFSESLPSAKQADTIQRIAAGAGDKDLATKMLDRPVEAVDGAIPETIKAKVVNDPLAKATIKQGFDEGFVAAVKATSPENKAKLLKMTRISELGGKNKTFGSLNRPSDVVGESLAERIKYVKKVNSDAGAELDKVADSLKGKEFDTTRPVNELLDDLELSGVKFDDKNQPDYKGSDFEGDEASQRVINVLVRRMKDTSAPDAYGAHRLKRFIDNKTTYGVSKEGLTGDAERIVKRFRANLDSELDGSFPEYNRVNTTYSDSVGALNDFQKAAGNSIDLFGNNSDKALGTVAGRLLSNAQSRVALMDSIKSVEDVSKKYGAKFNDDIITQVMFADELDKLFGSSASKSFLGNVEKGTATGIKNAQRDIGQTTALGAVLQGGAKAYDYLNRVTPERQYKSIKELLARDAKEAEQ